MKKMEVSRCHTLSSLFRDTDDEDIASGHGKCC